MIECVACSGETPSDSAYCDQCGVRLRLCEKCGCVNKNKFCTNCGENLGPLNQEADHSVVSGQAVEGREAAAPRAQVADSPATSQQGARSPGGSRSAADAAQPGGTHTERPEPLLQLVHEKTGETMVIRSGEILGRAKGPHTAVLGRFQTVSRMHAKLDYDPFKGWLLTDLGSSYGTAFSPSTSPPRLGTFGATPPDPVPISNGGYISLSDQVFRVQMVSPLGGVRTGSEG